MSDSFDGLISFFASHHAMRAEKTLLRAGFDTQLIPGPKELSPNCGVALRFNYAQREEVLAILSEKRIRIDEVHQYQPRTDTWLQADASTETDKTAPDTNRKKKWLW